ncbi:MAG: hypothetical protein KDC67_15885 [Ignavibacteriae bacterium]|nr:hypothetical protein [Ignavibacteriota bacterium]
MKYPNITLKIENYIPTIYYVTSDKEEKAINEKEESLIEVINTLGKRLDLDQYCENSDPKELCLDLLKLAEEGDERAYEDLPKIKSVSKNLDLEKNIEEKLSSLEKNREEIPAEANDAVKKEMRKYQNLDIFASMLDTIYNIIIANVVLNASELGIGNIYLEDTSNLVRLQYKMASELSKMKVELGIINSEMIEETD